MKDVDVEKNEIMKLAKEMSTKYNIKECVVFVMVEKCNSLGCNVIKAKEYIEEFLKSEMHS